jgi:putative hydrolase of the HAD superfamily
MLRAVLLDFYGTVAHAESWGPTREDVLAAHGYHLPAEVAARWNVESLDGLEHVEHSRSRDAYTAWERSRLEQFVADCGVTPDDAERLIADLDESSRRFRMAAYPEAAAVLDELRGRGLAVALCSNWSWDLDEVLTQTGLAEHFDVVIASAHAGARKPHPRVFSETLRRIDVRAAEALFVGDSFGPDVQGPLAAGMRAVHVVRDDDERAYPALPPGAWRVADLTGVIDIVDELVPSGADEREAHSA